MDLLTRMNQTIASAKEIPELEDLAVRVEQAVNKLGETAMHMGMTAMSEQMLDAFAVAHPFLDVTGDVVMAWLELWRAVTAQPKIAGQRKRGCVLSGAGDHSPIFHPVGSAGHFRKNGGIEGKYSGHHANAGRRFFRLTG